MSAHSPYEILEIPRNATLKDIKRRYKDLVRTFNPEHNPEKFMEIRAAYEMLTSTEMDAQDTFPIYKKPLEFLNQTDKVSNEQGLSINLLGTFFETPFNTVGELEKLFKQQ